MTSCSWRKITGREQDVRLLLKEAITGGYQAADRLILKTLVVEAT